MAALALPRRSVLGDVFVKTLRQQRRSLLWWGLGIGGAVLMYTAFWPSIRDNAGQFNAYLANLPDTVKNMLGDVDFGTPEGYVQSEVFAFMGPVLLLVYAIGAGARAVAGEEEDGTLDLLLSTPIRRRRVLVDTAAAMIAVTFGLATIVWLAVAVFGPISGLHVPILHLTAAIVNLFGLAVAFGAISLAVGSATGSKHLAIGVAAGLALVTFILNTLAPTVDALKPLRLLSPFHYYSGHSPITTGFTWADPLVLLGIVAVALLVAGTTLERRDLAA